MPAGKEEHRYRYAASNSGHFSNSISEYSGNLGIYITDCSPTISSSTIANNTSNGLYAYGSSSTPTITNNTFTNNTGYAVKLNDITFIPYSGNSGTGNNINGFVIPTSTIRTISTWSSSNNFPFVLTGSVTVQNYGQQPSLTISSGTIVKGISAYSPLDTSQSVTVTVGPFSQTIKMGEKGDKWEYKWHRDDNDDGSAHSGDHSDDDGSAHGGDDNSQVTGIKKMKIDWKKGNFDIKIDRIDLNMITNPVVFSVQIGNTRGLEYLTMEENGHYWDFHRQDDLSKTIASGEDPVQIPKEYALQQNYPNPFNAMTTIRYDLPEPSDVRIIIYDMLGRQVRTVVNQTQDAGYRSIIWDARNDFNNPVSAGLYLYQIKAGVFVETRKMILLK